jgi:sugar phosphate isomerase/epimerase
MRLGTVTYNIAKDWTLDEILERLPRLGFEGVELRTNHRHGVEPSLSGKQRDEVRRKFEGSGVELVGLGTACEFHSDDPAEVTRNVDEAKAFIRLAHDVGAPGIKVRPNGVPASRTLDATLAQIGKALADLGDFGEGFGVEVRLEVHGQTTQELPNIAAILRHSDDHPNVTVCWNSNPTDVVEGSVASTFGLVEGRIGLVHLRDLTDEAYPWRQLFGRLAGSGYEGFTLAEIPESGDPERVLRYFRALWRQLQPGAGAAQTG